MDASPAADAGHATAPRPRARSAVQPVVRPLRWLCNEQDCEHAPVFAYDYLPAVSANGEHVAIVEERDGWGHTSVPGVRIVRSATAATEKFFPLLDRSIDLARDLRRKTEYEALVRAANDGLAQYDFRPLFPAREVVRQSAEDVSNERGARRRGRATFDVAGIRFEVWSTDDQPPQLRIHEVVIHDGAKATHVSAADWDARSGCSTRAFRLVGARPDVKVAVFVSEIVMTGHNCDGLAERQPWAVRIVRW